LGKFAKEIAWDMANTHAPGLPLLRKLLNPWMIAIVCLTVLITNKS
jgi:hypothetical protein